MKRALSFRSLWLAGLATMLAGLILYAISQKSWRIAALNWNR